MYVINIVVTLMAVPVTTRMKMCRSNSASDDYGGGGRNWDDDLNPPTAQHNRSASKPAVYGFPNFWLLKLGFRV